MKHSFWSGLELTVKHPQNLTLTTCRWKTEAEKVIRFLLSRTSSCSNWRSKDNLTAALPEAFKVYLWLLLIRTWLQRLIAAPGDISVTLPKHLCGGTSVGSDRCSQQSTGGTQKGCWASKGRWIASGRLGTGMVANTSDRFNSLRQTAANLLQGDQGESFPTSYCLHLTSPERCVCMRCMYSWREGERNENTNSWGNKEERKKEMSPVFLGSKELSY